MLDVAIRSKAYRTAGGHSLPALRDVRFSVAPGEFVCLTGPSGCGKTTTLKLILDLDTDFDGVIAKPQGRVAAVFQEPRLLPWRTVEENLRLALPDDLAGVDLAPLLATLGLAGTEKLYPGELSLGMARRVGIARAFALQPALLTLDEPFVSLDDDTAARLRRALLDVWAARPTTALMVTHNRREAVELADRILVMSPRPGTIIAEHRIETPRAERSPAMLDETMVRLFGQP
ncbi:ABC transporter ATP-binding protein [Salmonella enterica subsp. enterica]|nr:ABC transporter ATP-binding protein [Salmonella enterica subsp. enterica serovar Enteritidis]